MIDWYFNIEHALMNLLMWFLFACFVVGAIAIVLDILSNRDE